MSVCVCLTVIMQSAVPLMYEGAVIGTAAFSFACHTLRWSANVWMEAIARTEHVELPSRAVAACARDL